MQAKFIVKKITKGLTIFLSIIGILTILAIGISFTSMPFWGIYALANHSDEIHENPDYIICMSGSGFPGESTLLRLYYTGEIALLYPSSKVIIAFPANDQNNGTLKKINKELYQQGIDSTRILFAIEGTNTRGQAIDIKENWIPNPEKHAVLLITSPIHTYRSYKVFKALNFKKIKTFATFENDISISLTYDSDSIGGKKHLPNIGNNTQIRYQFWNHLKYEIALLREYTAIIYYKIQGWL